VKATAKAMWSLGDYGPVAKLLEGAARDVVDLCGVSSGDSVFDVAAGTGNSAIAAASKSARVVASDLASALVETGQGRTKGPGLAVDWLVADVEDLPVEEGRFDFVTSVFGAIFAPRPELAASEMFRALRPGGVVGMANWTPESFAKRMTDVVSKYAPPPPVDLPSPFQWGEAYTVRSLFDGLTMSIEFERRFLTWEFQSPEEIRSVFAGHGGGVMAKRMLPPAVYDRMARDLDVLVREVNEGTQDHVVIKSEYLALVARKR
jgi:ubiquinone/menaquinone biosynthesis C-methylase UbiE